MAGGLPLNGCGKSVQDIEEQQVSIVKLSSTAPYRKVSVRSSHPPGSQLLMGEIPRTVSPISNS